MKLLATLSWISNYWIMIIVVFIMACWFVGVLKKEKQMNLGLILIR